jgi:hypothetical protein
MDRPVPAKGEACDGGVAADGGWLPVSGMEVGSPSPVWRLAPRLRYGGWLPVSGMEVGSPSPVRWRLARFGAAKAAEDVRAQDTSGNRGRGDLSSGGRDPQSVDLHQRIAPEARSTSLWRS